MDTKPMKPAVDWIAVEMHYRAGVLSLEAIGQQYGISKGRISQVATSKGWTRDLKAKIQAKANAKMEAIAVAERLNKEQLNNPAKQAARRLVEKDVIDVMSDQQVVIKLSQKKDIGRTRDLFRALLEELEAETKDLELFKGMGEALDTSGPDATGTWRKDKLNEIYQKVISQGGRIDGAKKLTEMLEKLVKMERQAFGIEDGDTEKGGVDAFLLSMLNKVKQAND